MARRSACHKIGMRGGRQREARVSDPAEWAGGWEVAKIARTGVPKVGGEQTGSGIKADAGRVKTERRRWRKRGARPERRDGEGCAHGGGQREGVAEARRGKRWVDREGAWTRGEADRANQIAGPTEERKGERRTEEGSRGREEGSGRGRVAVRKRGERRRVQDGRSGDGWQGGRVTREGG